MSVKGKNFFDQQKIITKEVGNSYAFLQVWAIFPGPSLCLFPSHCPYYRYLLHPLLTFPPLLPFDCLATTTFYLTLLHSTTTFSHISASTITFLPNSPGAAATPPFQFLCPLFFFLLTPLSTSTITIY